jgi:hypothetical protein
MAFRQPGRQPLRWLAFTLIALTSGAALAPQARAADLDKLDCSLKMIPADAAFYSTMLRNREQFDAILKSRAWAKLKSLPVVQMAWQQAQQELNKPGSPLAQFQKLAEQPENKQLLELLGDMVSHEIFIFADESLAGFADLAGQVTGATRFAPLMGLITGEARNTNPNELQARAALEVLAENPDLIKIPNVLIGFKLTRTDRAEAQLKRLEGLVNGLIANMPQLKPFQGRFQRTKVAGGDFLTLTLDGKMVPWKQIPFEQLEEKPGQYDPVVKKLSQLTVTISLGVRDNYLFLVIGESNAHVGRLGGQGQRLAQRPELKPLEKYADQRLTSISYVSQAFRARVAATNKDIDDFVKMIEEGLKEADLKAEQQARIRKDLDELAKDLKKFIPEVGAALAFSFLTPRGQESYSYDWGQHLGADGSKPLTLLDHVGGSPLLAAVGRSRYSQEPYQLLVKWLKVGHRYFEDFAVPNFGDEEKKQYEQAMKAFQPLFKRLDEATGKMLLPALADGQTAFVLDAKVTSKQWHAAMPEAARPLPLPEIALVFGVSDAALLRKAFSEYRSIANDLIAEVRKLDTDGNIPDFKIPPPKSRKLKNGELFFYPLPAQLGLDPQIAPNAGLSDRVATLALTQEHTERLLSRTPPKTTGGPLADANRPRAAAVYMNCSAFVDAVTPWVEWGVRLGMGDAKETDDILKQIRDGMEVLKVFRSYSSSSYFEDKALVTHSEMVVQDLK